MKKLIWFMAAVMLLAAFTACGKKNGDTKPTEPETNESSDNTVSTENNSVKVKRNENGSLTVNVDLSEYAGKDVSIVAAKDRAAVVKLEGADGVLAVEQITLDQNGKGNVTLMPSETGACFVGVNGNNIVQVKG